MKQLECMVAWTRSDTPNSDPYHGTRGQVRVGPWPDTSGWSDRYSFSTGACYSAYHDMSEEMRVAMIFIDFHTMVVRDGIDPHTAHEAHLAIDEYCERISPDIPGAVP